MYWPVPLISSKRTSLHPRNVHCILPVIPGRQLSTYLLVLRPCGQIRHHAASGGLSLLAWLPCLLLLGPNVFGHGLFSLLGSWGREQQARSFPWGRLERSHSRPMALAPCWGTSTHSRVVPWLAAPSARASGGGCLLLSQLLCGALEGVHKALTASMG